MENHNRGEGVEEVLIIGLASTYPQTAALIQESNVLSKYIWYHNLSSEVTRGEGGIPAFESHVAEWNKG